MTSPRNRIETLAAAARRGSGDLQSLLELGRLVSRVGVPPDLADPPLVRAAGEALWRRPDQRPLAHLLLRLLGLEPLAEPDERVPAGYPGATDVANGEAFEVASGLPLRLRPAGQDMVLRWVPAGPVRPPARYRFALGTVHVPGFLVAEAPVTVATLDLFLAPASRLAPAEWEPQRAAPSQAATGVTPALACDLADHLGLRLLLEAEWCRLAMGPKANPERELACGEASGAQGWLDLQALVGSGWEWVEAAPRGPSSVSHAGRRFRARGSAPRPGAERASTLQVAVPDAGHPWSWFRFRPARDLVPAALAESWRAPAAPAPPRELRLDAPVEGLPSPAPRDHAEATTLAPRPPLLHPGGADHLLWIEDPAWLVSAGPRMVLAWTRASGQPLAAPPAFARARGPLALAPGRLFTGLAGGGVAEWTLPDLALTRTLPGTLGAVDDLLVDDEALHVLDRAGRLTTLDLASGAVTRVCPFSRQPEELGQVLAGGSRVFFSGPTQLRCDGEPLPAEEALDRAPRVLGVVVLRRDRREWLLGWSSSGGRAELRRGGAGRGIPPGLQRDLRRSEVRRPLALDPTGEEAILTSSEGVCRADLTQGELLDSLAVPGGACAAAYAERGLEVAVASDPGPLMVWERASGAPRLPKQPPRPPPASLALAEGGASAWSYHSGLASPLQRWGEAPAEATLPPQGDPRAPPRVTLAPSFRGDDLLVLWGTGRVVVLNAHTLTAREHWSAEVGVARAASWDERKQRLLVIGIGQISLWQREEPVAAWETWDSPQAAGPAALATNGRSLAVAVGARLRLGRLEGARLTWADRKVAAPVRWLAVAPDGTASAAWIADGSLSVFRGARPAGRVKPTQLDEAQHPPLPDPGRAGPLAVGPKAAWVARGLPDGSVEVFDLRRRAALRRTRDHDGPVLWLATDPKGEYLASAGMDGAIRVRRVR